MANEKLLEIKNLTVHYQSYDATVHAVENLNLSLGNGETLGLVGETGAGKTTTVKSIMRILPTPPARVVSGEIFFDGQDLLKVSEKEMRKIRGNEISMIFQEPLTSLNPVFTVGTQIGESLRLHQGMSKEEARKKSIEMLTLVGIPAPNKVIDDYPHQLSGGMRQRVMIAMALACNPKILIADEPTTALDVTIQAQILQLLGKIKSETKTAIILITHDLGIVAQIAQNVMVMYAGQAVEYADVHTIFKNPLHPYTVGLLKSIPVMGEQRDSLYSIKGNIPSAKDYPKGCRFSPRCEYATEKCALEQPHLITLPNRHKVCCWKYEGGVE